MTDIKEALFGKVMNLECEFKIWGAEDGRGHTCQKPALKFVRSDGKRFDVIEHGCVKEGSKKCIKLCEQHYDEISSLVALKEISIERQFS